jgi:hypothetical protein
MIAIIALFLIASIQSINGMILGVCNEPDEWKTWLNVHRPTALGLF